jgi:hypothetical protein
MVPASRPLCSASPFQSESVHYTLNDSQCIACDYGVCGTASNCLRSPGFLINFAAFNARAGAPNTFLRSCRSLVISLPHVPAVGHDKGGRRIGHDVQFVSLFCTHTSDPDPLSPPQECPQPLPPRHAIDRLPTIAVSLPTWPCLDNVTQTQDAGRGPVDILVPLKKER